MWIDGEDRSPSGRIRRAIFGLLALKAGRTVDTELLIDHVWNGRPPASARSSLQMHITHLRRQFPVDGLLATTGGGYRLEMEEADVDALRFSMAAREGLQHLSAQRFSAAMEHLASALREWRDPPLPDLAHLEAIHPDMTELEALHQRARVAHATAMLETRGWTPDVAMLERLVERYPLDEAAWRLLVVGHFRASGAPAALEAFERAAATLRSEMGIDPGPRLAEVERLVTDRASALAPPTPPSMDLPIFTTPFFGRTETVRRLAKSLPEQRLTTLVGTGGVGKTRLAVEASRRAATGFPDGACFVGFETVDDPELVMQAIGEAVSPEDGPIERSPIETIGDRALLLILDNCEHLIGPVAEAVTRLLSSCPSLAVLATSRTPLGVVGEATWTVEPFELPEEGAGLEEQSQTESVVFFVECARRAKPDFELSTTSAAGISGICRDLAGIPLALELAASQCDVLTPADIHRRLVDRDHVARDGRGRPPRHRSIDEMVEWSLELLPSGPRRVFERMAVFAGAVDRRALASVCITGDADLTGALRALSESSLITVDLDDDTARFGQLAPLKQAARRRLPAEDREMLERSHMAYFFDLATPPAGLDDHRRKEWLDHVDGAIEEIRTALERSRRSEPLLGLRAAVRLLPYWRERGRAAEGRRQVAAARSAARSASRSDLAPANKAEGTLAYEMSALDEAELLLTEALRLYSELGDQPSVAATLNNLGVVAVDKGALDTALGRYRRARRSFESEEDRRGLAATALNLGVVELQRQNPDQARAWFERALGGFRVIGDRHEQAHAMQRLADVAQFVGDPEDARTWLHRSRRLYREIGSRDGVAWVAWRLADVAVDSGNLDVAEDRVIEAARAALDQQQDPWWIPGLLETGARIAAAQGESPLAVTLLGAASCFRQVHGSSRPAMADDGYTALSDELRDDVGKGYAVAFARGETLSTDEALDLLTASFGPSLRGGDSNSQPTD